MDADRAKVLAGLDQAAQSQPPPKQNGFPPPPFIHMEVVSGAPGLVVLRLLDRQRNELHLIPMSAQYARELANELSAPSVVPAANGHGGAPPKI